MLRISGELGTCSSICMQASNTKSVRGTQVGRALAMCLITFRLISSSRQTDVFHTVVGNRAAASYDVRWNVAGRVVPAVM